MNIDVGFLDSAGNDIVLLDLGVLERGNISEGSPLRLVNRGNKHLKNIVLMPVMGYLQQGSLVDTVNSTFLSFDGVDFYPNLTLNLGVGEERLVYVKWQPRWIATPMQYFWGLEIEIREVEGEDYCPD